MTADSAGDVSDKDSLCELAVLALADEFAHHRVGGDVFMDGSHRPTPSELIKARRFVEDFLSALR